MGVFFPKITLERFVVNQSELGFVNANTSPLKMINQQFFQKF